MPSLLTLLRRASLPLVGALLLGCHDAGAPQRDDDATVLFIGNSLTYENDLPGTVAGLAAEGGYELGVASVALPNTALIDHLTLGTGAVAAIERQDWEFVVLQQGPTPAGLDRDTLLLAVAGLDPLIRAAGGRPALLMPWSWASWPGGFAASETSFRLAAESVDGLFIPAGDAWLRAWAADASLALYGPDDYHPSALGTYLTALVVYERLTGGDARELPAVARADGRALDVPAATVALLQAAAHEANAAFPAR